jgi:mono/diheme cytochrome c family protein
MKNSWLALAATSTLVGCHLFGSGMDGFGDSDPYYDDYPPPYDGSSTPTGSFKPNFGATVRQADSPPPLSGGTLLALADGRMLAADPDRDRAYLVDVDAKKATPIAFSKHDEPGRAIEDASGRVHVVLRGGGAIATIDLKTGAIASRRDVCAAPRGIAFDGDRARIIVACESGELFALDAAPDGKATKLAMLDRDLRDVVFQKGRIFVSRFRKADVIELTWDGGVIAHERIDVSGLFDAQEPMLAFRMLPSETGDAQPVLVHEIAGRSPLAATTYYSDATGDFCNPSSPVFSAMSHGRGRPPMLLPANVVLPVDVAVRGSRAYVVSAGNGHTKELPQVYAMSLDADDGSGCGVVVEKLEPRGQATSLALRGSQVVVQSREPAQLEIFPGGEIISFGAESREDTGHAIFHANSGGGVACASCHGEGGDDGRVWTFSDIGLRRTPSLRGTLSGTAPYHWSGDEADIAQLADDVMTVRMNGPKLVDEEKGALQAWLFAIAAPAPAPTDATAAARGKTLFESAEVGCAACHSGAKLTSAKTVDVGTGGEFQVPSLVGVGARAPYLHDGCAATLTERFGSCGGGDQHGKTSQLSAAEISDLVSYLSSL